MSTFRQFVKQLNEARYPRPGTPEPPPLKGDPLTLFLAEQRRLIALHTRRGACVLVRRPVAEQLGWIKNQGQLLALVQTCTKPIR